MPPRTNHNHTGERGGLTTTMTDPFTGTYATAALEYWRAGWHGVLPLPPRAKKNPPPGYTGVAGATPSYPDVYAWTEGPEGNGNIALRLPQDVIGLDVDHYESKHGGDTITTAETRWGALPATWISTSRDDGISGIRLYRVPEGLAWPGELGPDVEIIQYRHRYAVVAPSVHPDGRKYTWRHPEGHACVTAAKPEHDQLPYLPEPWIIGLTAGELAPDTTRNTLAASQAAVWLANTATLGGPCRRTGYALSRAMDDLGHGSRHTAARYATLRLVRLTAEGHIGTMEALGTVRSKFLDTCTNPARGTTRRPAEAKHEWDSLLTGAVNLVTATNPPPPLGDPCQAPFHAHDRARAVLIPGAAPAPGTTAATPRLPPEFWDARKNLSHVRDAARARMVAPDALLGAVIARASLLTHHACVLPALPRTGSLNVIVALCGRSGDGKGAAMDAAAALLPARPRPCLCGNPDHPGEHIVVPAGSGEGLVRNFFDLVREPPPEGKRRAETKLKIDRRHVLVRIDEGEVLANLANRQGQTTMQILRQSWSGEELGFSYANQDKNLRVPAHAYRQSIVLGIQPTLAAPLFADTAGGTPQRFYWLGLTDPDAPAVAPEWPGPLADIGLEGTSWHGEMTLASTVTEDIVQARRNRLTGHHDPAPLDAHRDLCRLKVAALLARIEQRLHVSEQDWELAGVFMDTSDAVREWVRGTIAIDVRQSIEARAHRAADQQIVITDRLASAAVQRVATNLYTKLAAGPMTRAVLRRACTSRDRDHADAAIELMLSQDLITAHESPSHTGSVKIEYGIKVVPKP